ncbi:hypothetical protein HNP84_009451 [Thermocatellispora tengchongensis]|uniref:BP74 N-terminal domain-containing protein n=1 Tax=Thermocatellispora tengchongensis TaxID=1073253 RepID=A0A840PRF8_9ACTN|nr:calmodulin-binding protein [Thermocatellispora tengchongensis]MBB5139687.1 hypothetical protein [Thermocatellispora tengchongensis]
MPRIGSRIATLAAVVMLALTAVAAPASAQRSAAAVEAYFEFHYPPAPDRFVVKLTDPAAIQHARDLVSGATEDRPHIVGRIVKRPAPYNRPWSYHLDPGTVQFFDYAIEVCDASIRYVEDHLDEAGGAFLPGLVWCPWGSQLIREVPAP